MPQRTIAIGDIHGCDQALASLLAAIQPTPGDLIITLGDMVNRGPGSKQVLTRLLQLADECQYIPLRGNHDQMLLEALAGRHPYTWLGMGGIATLESYGLEPDLAGFPADHAEFLRSSRRFHESPTHLFVHASYAPRIPLRNQPDEFLLWQSLREIVPEPHISGKTAIVGHTSQKSGEILDLGHLICIDTCCYGGGRLTALDVETGDLWQVTREGTVVRSP